MIDFSVITSYWPLLLAGTLVSLQIAAGSCFIGIVGATLLAFGHLYGNRLVRAAVFLYVTVVRGTPMLIQIACAVFVFPQLGISLSLFWAATFAIGFNSSAYLSQIFISGIASVSAGQVEAAHVLGFTQFQTMRYIVIPQAVRLLLPALTNEFITLIKDSSLASTVGVMELTKQGSYIKNETYDALTVYGIVALIYLCLTSLVAYGVSYIEKRMNRHAAS
jgi:His/Glu/Gln/Arg/opine family amino acid ABC transporter permease subunit